MAEKKDKPIKENHQEKVIDLENKYKRALADYQNLSKQTAQDKADFARYANESLVRDFIPVYDYLKLSLIHAPADDKWLQGVKHVLNQFKKVLTDAGVAEIEALGKPFDHSLMEAIENEETTDETKDNLVAKELTTGYTLNGKVIIPSRVAVYKKL
jgi:molecular chaperone GrpE